MKPKNKLRNPRAKKHAPKVERIKMDAWEAAVLESLDSIARSMAASTAIQAESHAIFMADARLRQEQHAMLLEAEKRNQAAMDEARKLAEEDRKISVERLEEVRKLEAEAAEQNKSAVAREQATLAASREMLAVVKKTAGDGSGS